MIVSCLMQSNGLAAGDPSPKSGLGTLSLVSVGTGDPDNMTIRARKTIAAADIFFTMGGRSERYGDLLQGKPVHNAEHGLFGKGGAKPRISAEGAEILRRENRQIIREAVAAGKNVVILDNGDPTIFGPQIGYLREFADLNPVIVPGLSSFNAANAALKTSVVGGSGRAVMLTSASLKDGRDKFLAETIKNGVTLAFFMVRNLNEFIAALQVHLPKDMPVAIVAEAGSATNERVIVADLDTILARVGQEKLPPFLVYVGDFLRDR
ncbi:MAG: tetrapyrrole methylase [Deltaproteobacteria bacterium]|nr:tetrapyrrole methylase [Deltaproteobacteria bacterium]